MYAPALGTLTSNVLVRLLSELSWRFTGLVAFGYDFTPPVSGWFAWTPQLRYELAQMLWDPAPLPQMLL